MKLGVEKKSKANLSKDKSKHRKIVIQLQIRKQKQSIIIIIINKSFKLEDRGIKLKNKVKTTISMASSMKN